MASNKSSVIQFNDEQDVHSELQFQDFSLGESTSGVATLSPSGTYTSFPESPDTNAESEDLLGAEKKEESSFWKFSYYQSFFDIETIEFLQRLKWSFIPVLGRATFLDRQIRPKPDLYGPFWITFCLIYSTAIMSNVANYFNRTKNDWTFNFHRVSLAATAIYAYVFILPLIIWGLLKRFQYTNRYTLLEIICVYGYSLAIFVPISIFWIFDAAWLHWILVIIGIALTGAVLLQIFWPIFRDDNKKTGTILLCTILACHLLLGVGFGTLFFQQRVEWVSISTTSATVVNPVAVPESATISPPGTGTDKKISRSIPSEEQIKETIKAMNETHEAQIHEMENKGTPTSKKQDKTSDSIINVNKSLNEQSGRNTMKNLVIQKM